MFRSVSSKFKVASVQFKPNLIVSCHAGSQSAARWRGGQRDGHARVVRHHGVLHRHVLHPLGGRC